MIELWDVYTQMLGTVFSVAVGIYTFRLSSFFKGGMLYKPFLLMVPAFFLYALGSFIDIFALMGAESLHFGHFFAYLFFFILMTYSIFLLYKAWRNVGMGKV